MAAKKNVEANISVMPRTGLVFTAFDELPTELVDGVDTNAPFPEVRRPIPIGYRHPYSQFYRIVAL